MKNKAKSVGMADEEIVGHILAAAGAGLKVERTACSATYSRSGFASNEPDGPCCAIGAGLLYAGIERDQLHTDTCETFAKKYGVSLACAIGISDGFEDRVGCTYSYEKHHITNLCANKGYVRGFAIGNAVAEALELE